MRILLALLFTGEVLAAALTAAPEWNVKAQRAALQFRQETSDSSTLLLYYSNGESTSSGTTETICKRPRHTTLLSQYLFQAQSPLTHDRRGTHLHHHCNF